ncbi:MAG: haloacid dehalogenase type II [Thaumarchaeota archaeon]|nr:haloacid dehalogenase type II [Nitrososphaerota archaeon]MBI3116119.1 haloacid dehalogenase type II [Nitrososphaerota archaeon]
MAPSGHLSRAHPRLRDAIVFDLYGTLFDVSSVADTCERLFPGRGNQLSQLFREKQIEYTWRASLTNHYSNFEAITERAIRFVLENLGLDYNGGVLESLQSAYLELKPFEEVPEALKLMKGRATLAILSNGTQKTIRAVLARSSMLSLFDKIISVDLVRTYKPSPKVYALAPRILRVPKSKILFVSSNSWDAAGAKAFGLKVAWINRKGQRAFDGLGYRPDFEIPDLAALVSSLRK